MADSNETNARFETEAAPAPLAGLNGAVPPAPDWFNLAIAQTPERSMIDVLGAAIELLVWGERGKPGLILVHGNSAHADWWSFIAPLLAADYRVAALSLSGMGASDWRERYSFDTFAAETYACAQAAGLYEDGAKPIYVGHSFGGGQVFFTACRYPERMRGAILVDTGFGGPPPEVQAAANEGFRRAQERRTPNRVYPTLEAALARFRLMPPQGCENLYIADFIARRSLKRAPLPDGGGEGWTWRFDPYLFPKMDRTAMADAANPDASRRAPMVHIYGDRSMIIKRHGGHPSLLAGMPAIAIPDSEHHVMIDQPLALVAALRAVLAVWPA
jgi:pimeloyl-ACP methyl ester carboxylesterase